MATLRRWWVDKYHLPSSHELFQNQSPGELTQEMYEDLYSRKAELEATLESETLGSNRQGILEQYSSVCKALGETIEESDPLAAQWEKDLAEGRMPDLDALP